jgi:hypothetical protein
MKQPNTRVKQRHNKYSWENYALLRNLGKKEQETIKKEQEK